MKKLLSMVALLGLSVVLIGCTDAKKTEVKKVETKTETKDGKTTETKKVESETKTETKKDEK